MVEPAEILGFARVVLGEAGVLRGRRIVVTAGGTHEAIDPVRREVTIGAGETKTFTVDGPRRCSSWDSCWRTPIVTSA